MNPERETAIRRAFAAGEFDKGRRLWTQYAEELRAAIEDGSASPAMIAGAGQLVEWARLVVKSFRAHSEARINGARVAALYSEEAADSPKDRVPL